MKRTNSIRGHVDIKEQGLTESNESKLLKMCPKKKKKKKANHIIMAGTEKNEFVSI